MNMTTRILQAGFITLACIGTGCLAKAQQSKKNQHSVYFSGPIQGAVIGIPERGPGENSQLGPSCIGRNVLRECSQLYASEQSLQRYADDRKISS